MPIECADCGTDVSDSARKCPACEYAPRRKMTKRGQIYLVAGGILTFTVVGAIVGVPLWLLGVYRLYEAKEVTVESEYAL